MITLDELEVNLDALVRATAESAGYDYDALNTDQLARITGVVRDTFSSLAARNTDFGGLEAHAAAAIQGFGTPVEKPKKTKPEPPPAEPVVEDKPKKRGK